MTRIIYLLSLTLLFFFTANISAQAPKKWTSAEIYEGIEKLNFLGSALYVAAHPDDENTRLISWLANHKKAEITYLSLTRGDGGQNLIGTEIRELLGVLRTQELLAARRTDHGQQRFSRANDFSYSKHPDETFNIWDKTEILSDAVWTVRQLQPDIIINRFNHRTPGTTHGHHTASAVIGTEIFEMAANKNAFPEQLKHTEAWQAQKLFFNTSWWFYGSREKFAEADKSKLIKIDVGTYYPISGKSNTEIAALSRSMHKCQGFGMTGSRGSYDEYLELLKGEMPRNNDPFDGINTTWSRVKGGDRVGDVLKNVQQHFQFANPAGSISELLMARKFLVKLSDSYWKRVKLTELDEIIEACLALYVEVVSSESSATTGEEVDLQLEFTNRSNVKVILESLSFQPMNIDSVFNLTLGNNVENKWNKTVRLPNEMTTTNPYWLNQKASLGRYTVKDQNLRGLPETPRKFVVNYVLNVSGTSIKFQKEVVHKFRDPVAGEVFNPFEITPPVSAALAEKVYLFADEKAQKLQVIVKAAKANLTGKIELCHGEKWTVEPKNYDFNLAQKGEEQSFTFTVTPPQEQDVNELLPLVKIGDKSYTNEMVQIEYDHIPTQTIFRDASAKSVRIDLKKEGDNVAYIMGAGDKVPTALRQIGYNVTLLEDGDITVANLKRFDAVIVGIRAYNTNERMKFHQKKLLEYVENGGTMIVQYNTRHRLKVPTEELGPYPFKLSRDRVTVEEAPMRFLAPKHAVLNFPNTINQKDFDGWVQERGLYYPNEWDEKYTAIFSANDPGEDAKDGGMLVTTYGKGYYIYTGISFFRELPAGVPGAFRLFANMISIGKWGRP